MDSKSMDFMVLNISSSFMCLSISFPVAPGFYLCPCLIFINNHPLLEGPDLFHGNPDAIPDADRLDVAGVDKAIDCAIGDGEIAGDLIDPEVSFCGLVGNRGHFPLFFSRW